MSMPARANTSAAALEARVTQLVSRYETIHRERMDGLPVVNPVLRVEAVGFVWGSPESERQSNDQAVAEGVLVTPWFMSLVRLPGERQDHQGRIGKRFRRAWGKDAYDFLGSHDDDIGYHETCSLFSPMNDFDQQAVAIETAMQVVKLARPAAASAPTHPADEEQVPPRRAFFMARRSQGGAA